MSVPTKERWQLLPPLSTSEYAALRASVESFGILTPVTIDAETGELLDGHHRSRIAEELGIELPVYEHHCASDAERAAYAVAVNIERRHLSPEQVTDVRAEQKRIYLQLRYEKWTQDAAAKAVMIPQRTGSDWEANLSDTAKACLDQRTSIPRAARDLIADRALSGETHSQIAADYHVTRQRISQVVTQVLSDRQGRPEPAQTPGFPDGQFRAIVIDPPWPMAKIEREQRPAQGKTLDYPTMDIYCNDEHEHESDDICSIEALPVPSLADPAGCHLYLWTTHKFLPDALRLVEAWGGRYQCVMTWVKNVGITPFSWMYDTEHVIFANLGPGLELTRKGLRLSMSAPITKHSAKPDVFYERVLQASPADRLEMFARTEREGFVAWGNEVADDVISA